MEKPAEKKPAVKKPVTKKAVLAPSQMELKGPKPPVFDRFTRI